MGNLKDIEEKIWNCNQCNFNPSRDARYCGGMGTDYRVMFIAESPSTSGGTGKFMPHQNFNATSADKIFYEVRRLFGLENCYVTDFVKCGVANGKPTGQKVENCLSYLKEEINLVKPNVIVTVGKNMYLDINGKRVNKNFVTMLREFITYEMPIVSTWHYSYVWRYGKLKREDRINKVILNQIKPEYRIEYINQHKEIMKYI